MFQVQARNVQPPAVGIEVQNFTRKTYVTYTPLIKLQLLGDDIADNKFNNTKNPHY